VERLFLVLALVARIDEGDSSQRNCCQDLSPTRSDLDRSKTRINTRVNRNLTGAVLDLIPQIGHTGRALLVVAGFKMIKLHTSRRSYKRVAT